MVRAQADRSATRRRAGRPILVLAMASLVLAATGCGAAIQTTKAGVMLAKPRTLNLSGLTGNLPPGVGGDFSMTYQHGSTQFLPGDGFIVWGFLQGHGLAVTYCVVARRHPFQTFWCASTYSLPAGQIDAVGDYDNSPGGDAGTIGVVGGTGAYLGARGTLTTFNDDPQVTIHLK
jgi:hypothetical protein